MIEVEKKFRLNKNFRDKIEHEAKFLSKKIFHDVYYDTAQWIYTLQNMWLRKREQVFELKVGVQKERGLIDRYNEITDPMEILKTLNLPITLPIRRALKENQITPFCSFQTDRSKYQLEEFTIDIDTAFFRDLTYSIAEVELLVPSNKNIPEAEAKLIQFLEKEFIDWRVAVPGKLPYFLSQSCPQHYAALFQAKVI